MTLQIDGPDWLGYVFAVWAMASLASTVLSGIRLLDERRRDQGKINRLMLRGMTKEAAAEVVKGRA